MTFISVLLAFVFDRCFGESRRFHPLVGFGAIANFFEARFNQSGGVKRLSGVFAWCLAVVPLVMLAAIIEHWSQTNMWLELILSSVVLYLAIGWKSLLQHGYAVATPLAAGDLPAARHAVSMIVSRDTEQLDEAGVAKAATESMLENGADAIFSAVFWFLIAGIPGVVLYRLANTLDAMWGYKNERFLYFGWAAARIDDVLNFIPARITALSYALMGNTRTAFTCWREQAFNWKSPNAGPVMAAGAGAINVSLGGAAHYHNGLQQRPSLGPESHQQGQQPCAASIEAACALINRALVLWGIGFAALLMIGWVL